MISNRLNEGRDRNSRNVRARSRRSSNFVDVFASGRNYQGNRNGVSTVGDRLGRNPINCTRPRCLKGDLSREIYGIIYGTPRNGARNGRSRQGRVTRSVLLWCEFIF